MLWSKRIAKKTEPSVKWDKNRLSSSRMINTLTAILICDSGHFVVTYSAFLALVLAKVHTSTVGTVASIRKQMNKAIRYKEDVLQWKRAGSRNCQIISRDFSEYFGSRTMVRALTGARNWKEFLVLALAIVWKVGRHRSVNWLLVESVQGTWQGEGNRM